MQAIETENLILYQTDLRGQWPQESADAFARRLPYARRLALRSSSSTSRASLAGIALALRALRTLLGRSVEPGEILFAHGAKPRLASPGALAVGESLPAPALRARGPGRDVDFSISHAGPWAACAALLRARVGLDVEVGTGGRIAEWVVREAALKASGEGLRALAQGEHLTMHADQLRWRGQPWYVRRLEGFDGACACVVSSCRVHAVETHVLALAELFGS